MRVAATILVIDEDEATRELYRRTLERHFQVLTSADGKRLDEICAAYTLALVVLDPYLQRGVGWQLIERFRAPEQRQPLPVVICSAVDDRSRGAACAVACYLIKPVLPDTLLSTVQRFATATTAYSQPL
jgi:DNA-binding response OmpR family regulator